MSFPKRMMYGTKELWNKIITKISTATEEIKTWCTNLLNTHNTSIDSHPNGFNGLHSLNSVTIETLEISGNAPEPALILKTNNARTDQGKGQIAYVNANHDTICGIDCDYINIPAASDGYALEVHLAHTPPTAGGNVVLRITNTKKHGMRTFIFGELYVNGKRIG